MTPDVLAQGILLAVARLCVFIFIGGIVGGVVAFVGVYIWSESQHKREDAIRRAFDVEQLPSRIDSLNRAILASTRRKDWESAATYLEKKFALGVRSDGDVECYQNVKTLQARFRKGGYLVANS
jgi:hypothetical protein